MKIAKYIRIGTIGINGGISKTVDLPFGGYEQGDIGEDWGLKGFDEYLETKVTAVSAQ